MSVKIISPRTHLSSSYVGLDDIAHDAVALFTGQKQGHMERWEYGPSLFQGDPAGGSDHWADLVRHPGQYYLTNGDADTISWAVKQDELLMLVSDVESVMELGPGSHEAIVKKTIPFLNGCPKLKQYIAVDATLEQAADAARTVKDVLAVEAGVRSQNYMSAPIEPIDGKKSAIVMWGSSLGNIDGTANSNPFQKLAKMLDNFKAGLQSGDLMILCVDTEHDEKKVLSAYSEPSLRAQILSVVHRLKRDGYATGRFDPKVWRHESAWFPEVGQCAHMIYPLFDQTINIAGRTIQIPAWRRFISNNSYKFSPEIMIRASRSAGLDSLGFLKKGPIALFLCRRK